ncbi:MAG: PorV/PorQ family protein [Endomicrobium sp.]|nr:PorV/PorQ family protein [Endomicrobium sp.]
MKKIKFLLSAFLFLAAPAAVYSGDGITALPFLEMGAGARYIAMGGVGTALAEDSAAMYWNPSLLTGGSGGCADLMHAAYDGGSHYDWISASYAIGTNSAIGFCAQYFSAGTLEEFGASGENLGRFTPYDAAVGLGYAVKIGAIGIGVAAKYIRSQIISAANAYAFDFGISAPDILNGRLKLGAAITNVSEGIKYDSETEDLPMALRFGAGFFLNDNLLVLADIGKVKGRDAYAAFGGEFAVDVNADFLLALRAGYNTIAESEGLSGLCAGIGIGYKTLLIDYAFSPMGNLGDTHRASVTLYF